MEQARGIRDSRFKIENPEFSLLLIFFKKKENCTKFQIHFKIESNLWCGKGDVSCCDVSSLWVVKAKKVGRTMEMAPAQCGKIHPGLPIWV